ncbi:MAG: amidohydrolase, partial [Gammaproteobacteria bacterium]
MPIARLCLLLLALCTSRLAAHPLSLAPAPPAGATPVSELASVPEDAARYVLVSSAGEHGRSARWRDADGSLRYRESMNLRGQVFEQDARLRSSADGLPALIEVRGFTPQGDAAERFVADGGKAQWKSPLDAGESADVTGRYYISAGGPSLMMDDFSESLYAAPGHRLELLPGGAARMERLADTRVGSGTSERGIELWAITGFSLSPVPVWMAGDRFFAWVSWVSLIPAEHAGEIERLQRIQDEALARRNPAFVERFGGMPGVPVAFEDVKTFDSLAGRWLEGQTVVVEGGTIAAAGASGDTPVPPAARRIPGRGKTLVPGLWDAHMHFGDDASGPMLLSIGVTSARDPGADIEPAKARLARIASAQLLAPTIYTSVLIDGAGPLAAQGGVTVRSADEAVAAVRRAHADGFRAIKFYTSMKPEWLAAGAAEAKRLGLHVHGHVPATMRALDAIDAGYDEITHVNFLAMQAMPDSVVDASNGFARFEGPARYARDIDLDAPPMSGLIERMARDRIVSDPTLVVFETMLTVDPGEVAPAGRPLLGTLPAQ